MPTRILKSRLTDINGEKGRSDLRIPSLEEYISICKKYEKKAVLELKKHLEEGDVEKIVKIIEALEYFEGTIFISFNYESLETLKKLRPEATAHFASAPRVLYLM